jgi:hypothetical protein
VSVLLLSRLRVFTPVPARCAAALRSACALLFVYQRNHTTHDGFASLASSFPLALQYCLRSHVTDQFACYSIAVWLQKSGTCSHGNSK